MTPAVVMSLWQWRTADFQRRIYGCLLYTSVIAPAYLTGIHPLASVMGIYPHISEAAAAMVESLMQGVLSNTSPLVCVGSLQMCIRDRPETSIGKYGRMRKSYLKKHRPILYNQLLMSEKLYPHLLEIDRTAQERVDTMLPHMMEAAGVTEELKACDPMRWVGLMNTLTAQIEEILIWELICS